MNTISGKIVLKETGVGIPDLLVAVYDRDSDTPEEVISSRDAIEGDSLGSVLTDESGTFGLSFKDDHDEVRESDSRDNRPDYLLFVLAPDEPGKNFASRILHASTPVGRNAGRIETHFIRLSEKYLQKADVPVPPQAVEAPENVVARIAETTEAEETINSGIREIRAQRLEQLGERTKRFTEALKPQIREALSGVSQALRASDTFVTRGERIGDKRNIVAKRAVAKANETSLTGHFRLSEKQIKELQTFQNENGDFVDIPEKIIEPLLFGSQTEEDSNSVLFKQDPIPRLCREKTQGERCLEETGESEEDEEYTPDINGDTDTPGDGAEFIGPEDIPRYVAPLIDGAAPPEEPVSFGITTPEIGRTGKKYRRASIPSC